MDVIRHLSLANVPNRRGTALSVLAHVAVLLWLVSQPPPWGLLADPMDSLTVEIVEPEPPPPAAEPQPESARPKELPALVERPAPRPVASKPARPAPPVDAPAAAIDTVAAIPAAPNPTVSIPATPPQEDPFPAFVQSLWRHIAAHPPTARRHRGVTLITFTLGGDGAVLAAAITESSGSAVHDRAALAALVEAAPLPRPPPDIAAARLTFTIPFEFH